MTRATFKKGARVEGWERNLDNPQRALKQVGILLVAAAQEAFADQAHGPTKWKPRAVPNVYGILADIDAGKTPPGRRFEDRPALVDTGRLRSSISFRLVSAKVVEVGSNLPYADRLNRGGDIESVKITEQVQSDLAEWLKTKSAQIRDSLDWLLSKSRTDTKLEGKVEARPFIGLNRQIRKDILQVVGVSILETK